MAVVDPQFDRVLRELESSLPHFESAELEVEHSEQLDSVRKARRTAFLGLLLADLTAATASVVAAPLLFGLVSQASAETSSSWRAYSYALYMVPVFVVVFAVYGLYRGVNRRISRSVFNDLSKIAHSLMIIGFLCAIGNYVAFKAGVTTYLSVGKIVATCVTAMVLVPLMRIIVTGLQARQAAETVPIVVVGTGKLAETVASHLRAHSSVQFVGFVDDNPMGLANVLGELDDLPSICARYGVARVVVCFSQTHPERTINMLKSLSGRVPVSIVPRYYELVTGRTHVEDLSGLPMLDVAPSSLSDGSRFIKRTFDIVVSSLVLLVTLPLLLVMAVAVKTTSPGPVFFRQERTGRGRSRFEVLKFRTMYVDAEERRSELLHLNEVDGPLFKVTNDPRVTKVGRLLRKTSLDELPQLINVWKGDMSLVGPRPFIVAEADLIEGWATKRFEARPGMTGLWQVSGRNELSYMEMCRLDYQYVASWSFWWDVQILWHTPATIFRGRGAS